MWKCLLVLKNLVTKKFFALIKLFAKKAKLFETVKKLYKLVKQIITNFICWQVVGDTVFNIASKTN